MSTTPTSTARTSRANLGELRPSQILFTFGVGSVVDLPNLSVMVMGLDDWDEGHMRTIEEPRLLEAVRAVCGAQVRELRLPPSPETRSTMPRPNSEESLIGVPVAVFPRWLSCTRCRQLAGVASGLFRLSKDPYRSDRTRFIHENCRVGSHSEVLPVRFLTACEKGHLDDFPWIRFVHRGDSTCIANLELRAISASGEVASLLVTCRTCNKSRMMSNAFDEDAASALGSCTGRRPQLRDYEQPACDASPRAILLGASNLWFPVPLTALAIPRERDELAQAVAEQWSILAQIPAREHLQTLRLVRQIGELSRWSDDEVWSAIEARRSREPEPSRQAASLRIPEWEAFTRVHPANQSEDFKEREVEVPREYAGLLRRVVLVERLREVRALAGFTRIAPPGELDDATSQAMAPRAPISRRPPLWVPACDVRGEGIFLEIKAEALEQWLGVAAAQVRDRMLFEAHREDRIRHQRTPVDQGYPGFRYALLHSLSHALLSRLTIECGYTMASIRERIYSRTADGDGPAMAGLLLYTAAPDSEGTLGGLVRLGEPEHLGRLLDGCLHDTEICASDPLCAEHNPAIDGHGLHGAACHACLFLPETCCERGNRYLDRAALVRIFGSDTGGFFSRQP
jgi:Domain of unknown function (DUF1998)